MRLHLEAVHQRYKDLRPFPQDLETLFEPFRPCLSKLTLPRVIEVIGLVGVGGIHVTRRRQKATIGPELEVIRPYLTTGLQEPSSTTVDLWRVCPRAIAQPAGIEAVSVFVDLPTGTDRNPMLDPCDPQPFGTIRQIRLVKQTESTGETKLPAQAGPVVPITESAGRGLGSMASVNPGGGGASSGRQDLHLFRATSSPHEGRRGPLLAASLKPPRNVLASPSPLPLAALASGRACSSLAQPRPDLRRTGARSGVGRDRGHRSPGSWRSLRFLARSPTYEHSDTTRDRR